MFYNTMAKLSEFSAQLKTRNVSRPSQYFVEITAPPDLKNNTLSQDKELVSMWCHTAHTPQINIFTRDDYIEAGTKRKYAYDQEFQNLTLTFYLDQEYKIKQFFDEWKYLVVPNKRNFNFPDNYTAETLKLNIINQEERVTYLYEFSRLFPRAINSVDLSYSNSTSVAMLTVDFTYEDVFFSKISDTGDVLISSKPEAKVIRKEEPKANTEANNQSQTNENSGGYTDQLGNAI